MAFPTWSIATSAAASTTSANFSIPSPSAGDFILLCLRSDTNNTPNTPSGFTLLGVGSNTRKHTIFGKVASGSEGTSINVTFPSSDNVSCIGVRVQGVRNAMPTISAAGEFYGGQQPDPGSVNTSSGTEDNLFLVSLGDGGNPTSWPTNYTNSSGSPGGHYFDGNGIARTQSITGRQLANQTDDPSAFDNGFNGGVTFTLVFRPAATGSYTLTADTGNFTLTGIAADLRTNTAYTLLAERGTFTLTGADSTSLINYSMPADTGTYNLTGVAATLVKGGSQNSYTLIAETGVFNEDGIAANTIAARIIQADVGNYALTGVPAGLFTSSPNKNLVADLGGYTVTGRDVNFLRSYVMQAETGFFNLNGQVVTLRYSAQPIRGKNPYKVIITDGIF